MGYPTPDDMSDMEFMERPALWPLRSSLPIKRWVRDALELGYLLREGREDGWRVHRQSDGPILYETIDDLIRDGWVVD